MTTKKRRSRRPYQAKYSVLGFSLVAAFSALTAWSCSSSNDNPFPIPCETVYEGLCGTSCTIDSDCPAGLHCAEGACYAACAPPGSACADGTICEADGRCGDGSGGNGGMASGGFNPSGTSSGGQGGGTGGEGGSCGSVEVTFEPQVPTVVLLIDQSGSMTANFNGQERWDVVYDALMDPTDGVVKLLEDKVRFGLALYTYSSGTCPNLVEVTPTMLNNHGAIDAVYSQEVPLANTPTGDSLDAITPALVAFNEPGPKLIILATDGDPDTCEDPDGHNQAAKDEATDAASAAYNQGIETVIIAVGNQVSETHQQDMANAGKGLPVPAADPCNDPNNCAPTYEPTTKQAMVDAFTDIINGQRTCVFMLDGAVIPGKECEGTVTVNGMPLGCNDPNGWQLNNPSEIEFLGTACDSILGDPNVTVTASFPCDAIADPN